jgi:hypothetical protein
MGGKVDRHAPISQQARSPKDEGGPLERRTAKGQACRTSGPGEVFRKDTRSVAPTTPVPDGISAAKKRRSAVYALSVS